MKFLTQVLALDEEVDIEELNYLPALYLHEEQIFIYELNLLL